MKKTIIFALAAAALFAGCKQERPEFDYASQGPRVDITDCDASAYMGANVAFMVTVVDNDYALSTLKAELLFDETVVAEKTIRTKENGTYEDVLQVPLLKSIPDGNALLRFTAQNVGLAKTTVETEVAVARPDFATLKVVTDDAEYTLKRVDKYQYELTDNFPQSFNANLVTPAVNDRSEVITLGWDGSKIAVTEKPITFANMAAGKYTISADLLTLTYTPNGSGSGDIAMVKQMTQGAVVDLGISDLANWKNLDTDFFNVDGGTVTWNAVDGLYRFDVQNDSQFIRVDAMVDEETYATLDENGVGCGYAIGSGIGKPKAGSSWNTTDGAWCLAQVSDKVFQITWVGGVTWDSGVNFKIFSERGWGGELGYSSYASTDLKGFAYVGDGAGNGDSGNIYATGSVQAGKAYRFTFDMSAGRDATVLTCDEIDIATNVQDISLNGVSANKIDDVTYRVPCVDLTKDAAITIDGVSYQSWWPDPDYLYVDGSTLKFGAATGKYMVDLHLDNGYAVFKRLNSGGTDKATSDDGAVWLMAWGLANWKFCNDDSSTNELAFNPGSAYCMAEVEDGVFQFSGYAVEQTDAVTLGGRFRFDYMSAKWFGQDGWGNEKGKIKGTETQVVYTERALQYLAEKTGGDNIELAEGVTLEIGSFYVLTVDISVDGVETVDFYKK